MCHLQSAAMLIADGTWDVGHMVNVEELDPAPFIELMNRMGLVTRVRDSKGDRVLKPQNELLVLTSTEEPDSTVAFDYFAHDQAVLAKSPPSHQRDMMAARQRLTG
jgi:hypothetical protein